MIFCSECKLKIDFLGIENGIVVCSDAAFAGSTCDFQCDPTHQLIGLNRIFCDIQIGEVAVWSANTPECRRKF